MGDGASGALSGDNLGGDVADAGERLNDSVVKVTGDAQPLLGARSLFDLPDEKELLERRKTWRREEARRKGLPSYVIFHDRTLEELAATHPRDRAGLGRVRGIGPSKLEAYGEALLGLLA